LRSGQGEQNLSAGDFDGGVDGGVQR
jgi:hypothetical protein